MFAAMACENLVFPTAQKLIRMTHSNETQGDLMRPFLVEFLNFLTKSNGLEKTPRERIFVVELNIFRKYILYIIVCCDGV